jgi:gamma-glutamylaminecyclotransferase
MPAKRPYRTIPVFVYGTLKRGGPWNHLLSDCEFVGSGKTVSRYPMIIDGIPYLLDEVGGHQVQGELFNVTTPVLRALDALEQHPYWYRRKDKTVSVAGNLHQAYIYFLNPDSYNEIGDWKARVHHSVYSVDHGAR